MPIMKAGIAVRLQNLYTVDGLKYFATYLYIYLLCTFKICITTKLMKVAEKIKYAINRYTYEAERHYNILNDRLANNEFMLGANYTIVDMAVWGWTRMIEKVIAPGELAKRTHLKRLMDEINTGSASQAAENIANNNSHNFKMEIDEEASKFMFPQNERLK